MAIKQVLGKRAPGRTVLYREYDAPVIKKRERLEPKNARLVGSRHLGLRGRCLHHVGDLGSDYRILMEAHQMTDKLYRMKLRQVAYSSIVGASLEISMDGVGVVALLPISVPNPTLDYKTVANAVAKAVMNGHVSREAVTLVLPEAFGN